MYTSIADIQKALLSGTSSLDITHFFLNKIESAKQLNAFLEVFTESAIRQAKHVDEKIKLGTQGKLAGVVIAIKDNICYENHKVSASSKILDGFESLYTATALQRLIDEDAVIIGRLNCDEFAMGSSNENSAFGPVLNAQDTSKVPGGSSGGSAVAVQAGLCIASLGSDTGGSIRQPASFTGTFGLKPTYGAISRYGLIAYASSFDQIGVFSNSIDDTAVLFNLMAGPDEFDSTCVQRKKELTTIEAPKNKLKFAVFNEYLNANGMDSEVKDFLLSTIKKLEDDGHTIVYESFPYLDVLVPLYYVLTTAEASSNLSRFDGVHYGYRSPDAIGVEQTYVKSRSIGFGKEVKRRIMAGSFVLSHGYYDAYYTKAQKVRQLVKQKTDGILSKCDVILMPTTPSVAFDLLSVSDPVQMYLQDIFTVHANISGNPAISLPFGEHSSGLPFGIQLMSQREDEQKLLNTSKLLEKLLK
ncbi:MAG: Asp-tRNA(Asn)/Glu-tRNA(Gln) amidotransferase subunit GatA [Crocinitomicaceae bacterium]|jgi:aspartyl-tRNA(Asn)/glutamyl-tRNA(Gln) amidotransferase subunit A|nr:Asp-tRNA(Asn)/Glu-tRNA(Gln) amidotransferase subunit GatA [Crocinitomicaceae bacterium]MCF8409984.1 Asp-tRNA(Asn)/Glu-tRNA(Gln) amidotransferase subunit GatA [Crocinitomicaceae bacterium]MCF8443748.1 Asp-tRNA(Asn)/Glu-tRNA(Gln) amidotransferase subunit GatA [Crocinitomicaceae bacterium]